MPRCNSRSCHRCFPPNAEEQRALEGALDAIGYEVIRGPVDLCFMHEHLWQYSDEPWFHALVMAYNAGIKAAKRSVEQELGKYR